MHKGQATYIIRRHSNSSYDLNLIIFYKISYYSLSILLYCSLSTSSYESWSFLLSHIICSSIMFSLLVFFFYNNVGNWNRMRLQLFLLFNFHLQNSVIHSLMNLCDPFDDSIPKFYELHIVLWKEQRRKAKQQLKNSKMWIIFSTRVISAVEMVNIV